ncbi:NADPH-dependent ferric siderophore reductase, contains FAD-binding and SIP domains [Sanguibacter gelidistatuariae]|uniref:NADPH-dependent ferric siderophore reductase, contains FAD-binding and SIP domains n=1 Tax=Sanguibacter gelidistatuariae TaxID=1814289 RepID=A0A1G6HD35_9MICO|nr:siderophore-interacting protein [Sanguibacter gelidistatuariae]SDB92192.1 NADPH-dependent ferric siderophore reductase, contains FAD-binding and SIP domains [Sanguibacter gelidistatuariae]
MSSTAQTQTMERTEPAYRVFAVRVARVQRLSPSFVRITFTGPDLHVFGTDGLDQRIKVVLPTSAGRAPLPADFAGDSWYQAWRDLPEDERCPLRTYTVRAVRPDAGLGEVDIDFVLHGDGDGEHDGPASRWVAAVRPGAESVLIGPNGRYDGPPSGIEWAPPAEATRLVLAGDEAAAPAITAILESLAPGTRAHAFIEVPHEDDALPVSLPDGVRLTWLPRHGQSVGSFAHEHGVLLDRAVREHMRGCAEPSAAPAVELEDVDIDTGILWEVPVAGAVDAAASATELALRGCYAWIAGEAGVIKDLRRHLVRDLGIDRRSVAFMGYWRLGKAEC